MLNQKTSCTSTGVPRKNQMYSQDADDSIGLADSRISARATPPTMPMTMAITVSSMVATRPLMMPPSKKNCWTVDQSRFWLVTSMWTSIAAKTRTMRPETIRPGCRTGTARMVSGRAVSVESTCVTKFPR